LTEVNLEVDTDVGAQYKAWLRSHMEEMLSLPGFQGEAAFESFDDFSLALFLFLFSNNQLNTKAEGS
jgi:hypothetical protein